MTTKVQRLMEEMEERKEFKKGQKVTYTTGDGSYEAEFIRDAVDKDMNYKGFSNYDKAKDWCWIKILPFENAMGKMQKGETSFVARKRLK